MKARRQQQQQQSNSFISREMSLRSFLTHLFLFRGPWSLWMTMQLVLRHGDVTGAETIVLFQTVGQCPGQVLSSGLRYDSFAVRSKVQCAALCLPDFSCRSFLFNRDEGLCYLGSQAAFANCSNMDPAPPGLQHFDMVTFSFRHGNVSFFVELRGFVFGGGVGWRIGVRLYFVSIFGQWITTVA